jgi:hypothetical protein
MQKHFVFVIGDSVQCKLSTLIRPNMNIFVMV